MKGVTEQLWRFARGDTDPRAFEAWLYAQFEDPALTELLGAEFVQALLEHDYNKRRATANLRDSLFDRLRLGAPSKCRCLSWRDREVLNMGIDDLTRTTAVLEDFFDYSVVARQTPWLDCVRCRNCSQVWYLAVDTVDDQYHLVRLQPAAVDNVRNGVWPSEFDQLEAVWPTEEWLAAFGFASLEDWRQRGAI